MLNNGLFFSLIISALATGLLYLLTNRKEFTDGSNYDSKELLKVFSIIFVSCFSINYLKNSNFTTGHTNQVSMRSGETLLTHSSRPPF
tara:strand:- start:443 stop:706 length:264 start_codon:yes stop_codon:yes gene_type:complete